MNVRLFICVELPAADKRALADLQNRLRAHGAKISWPAGDTLHVTLVFLGETDEARVADIAGAMDRCARSNGPFDLAISGCGAFPSLARPQTLWVSLGEDTSALEALHDGLHRELAAIGLVPNGRRFRPHVTIGRVKDARDAAARSVAAELERETVRQPPFRVAEIVLMHSVLDPRGARHTPIHRSSLDDRTRLV